MDKEFDKAIKLIGREMGKEIAKAFIKQLTHPDQGTSWDRYPEDVPANKSVPGGEKR